jgi:ribosome modulation factor
MGKKVKYPTAYVEGRKAALATQGRSANPYPYSAVAERHQWFKGYDEAVDETTRGNVKGR